MFGGRNPPLLPSPLLPPRPCSGLHNLPDLLLRTITRERPKELAICPSPRLGQDPFFFLCGQVRGFSFLLWFLYVHTQGVVQKC